ncbi:MAG: TrkA family potassium uptake protein [Salinirussus sp.]
MSTDLRVIIVGGGHAGFHTAEHLHSRGHEVVIVDKDPARCEFLNDQYVATVFEGDGTRPDVLRQTQPENSDVIAAMIGDSTGTNVGICATARRLAPDIRTVARIDHGDEAEYSDLVDRVVFPEKLAAHAATNQIVDLVEGGVRTIEQINENLELIEVTVLEGAPGAGRTLADVSFPHGSVVVADCRSDEFPSPEMVLEPGTPYIVATRTSVADEVVQLLRG